MPAPILCSNRRPSSGHRCTNLAAYMGPEGLMFCSWHAADRAAESVMTPAAAVLVGAP